MEAVHHYEGTVNQVMDDGIMALLGAPLAHEDHAVRAGEVLVRAIGSDPRPVVPASVWTSTIWMRPGSLRGSGPRWIA